MATIKSVTPRYRGGRTNFDNPEKPQPTSIQVTFRLSVAECRVLPTSRETPRVFGRAAQKYEVVVRSDGGELVAMYRPADAPFGSTDLQLIPQRALAHINDVLQQLLNNRQPSPVKKAPCPDQTATGPVTRAQISRKALIRGKQNMPGRPVTSVRINILLSPEEAQLLPTPRRLKQLVGRDATSFTSEVREMGGELTFEYYVAKRPFNGAQPEDIPELVLELVRRVLADLA